MEKCTFNELFRLRRKDFARSFAHADLSRFILPGKFLFEATELICMLSVIIGFTASCVYLSRNTFSVFDIASKMLLFKVLIKI